MSQLIRSHPASERGSASQRPWQMVVLASLLLVGAVLLLYKFPSIPIGLHQDEMSEAYEAYSLLHTGADRWGYHLPVYFLSWGSGQNVLQAYLTIPVVAVLGLTPVSARLIPLLCGLATLPLFFFTLRRWFGENVALVGLLFLCLSPWHIMLSRIGIENSPIPFFILLGVFTFGKALDTRSPWVILPCLLPFDLALYTYGVVVVVIPVLVPLLFLIDPATILKSWRPWLGALILFCLAALPIAFFTFKNYVTKTSYAFERWLPFSVPMLTATRLSESKANLNASSIPSHNIHLILNGFSDQVTTPKIFWPGFMVNNVRPVPAVLLLLALLGIILLLRKAIRERRFTEPFLPWLVACSPMILLVPLNISRAIAIFLPILALAAFATMELYRLIPQTSIRSAAAVLLAGFFLYPVAQFVNSYYTEIYAMESTSVFNPQLPEALHAALHAAGPGTPIYVTSSVALNYVQVLFLTRTDPRVFQTSGATTKNPDFGPYRFSRETLANTPVPFIFIVRTDDVARWNLWHAYDLRLQRQPLATEDALLRWSDLLPPNAADLMNRDLDYARTGPLAAIREGAFETEGRDPYHIDVAPLCSVPTQVVSIGQFLVGRCP